MARCSQYRMLFLLCRLCGERAEALPCSRSISWSWSSTSALVNLTAARRSHRAGTAGVCSLPCVIDVTQPQPASVTNGGLCGHSWFLKWSGRPFWKTQLEKGKFAADRVTRACTHKSQTLIGLAMSASLLEVDIRTSVQDVRFGPQADIENRARRSDQRGEVPHLERIQ